MASLSLYVDGQLEGGTRARVGQHIGVCSRCRSELEELRRLAALLADSLAAPARSAQDGRQALARAKERIAAIRRVGGRARAAWLQFPESALPVLAGALLVLLALADTVGFGGLEEDVVAVAFYLELI